jgi:xanthine dehydrogenase small subunit
MRNEIIFYVNGVEQKVSGSEAFMNLSEYLRYQKALTGTKVVCAEGDCGACTVLLKRSESPSEDYFGFNSCIAPVYALDGAGVVTVEGLKSEKGDLHPAQKAMVKTHGAQCGYCTPGFICSLAGLAQDAKKSGCELSEKKVRNHLTGNLCRCTGYDAIIQAGTEMDLKDLGELPGFRVQDLSESIQIRAGDREVFLPISLNEALQYLSIHPDARVVSGSTDLGVVQNKGKLSLSRILGLHRIRDLYQIAEEQDHLRIGARVSLSRIEKASESSFPEFSRILRIFASPQIKNSGSLVGNLVNASPIADTIPFLRVAEAEVVLQSSSGERNIPVNEFLKPGYKQLDLKPGELVREIRLRKVKGNFKLFKVSARRDLDISAVTFAAYYELRDRTIVSLRLAMGGVGPSVLRLHDFEKEAIGKEFDETLFRDFAERTRVLLKPVTDVRGSAAFRHQLCYNLMMRFHDEVVKEMSGSNQEASV